MTTLPVIITRSNLCQVLLMDMMSDKVRGVLDYNPGFQRQIDHQRVADIVTTLKADKEKYRVIEGLGVLIIGVFDKKRFLIDGQHRFLAYCELQEPKILDVQEWTCGSMEEVIELFRRFNLHVPIADYIRNPITQDHKQSGDALVEYVQREYKKHISTSITPNFPNININVFRKVSHLLPGYENLTIENAPLVFEAFNTLCRDKLASGKKDDRARYEKERHNTKPLFINRELRELVTHVV